MSGFAFIPKGSPETAVAHGPQAVHDDHALLPYPAVHAPLHDPEAMAQHEHDEHSHSASTTGTSHAASVAAFGYLAPEVATTHTQRDAAVDAQVRVSDVDAAIQRKAAAGTTMHTADALAAATTHTEVGPDGKPTKITTVEHEKDGTVKVTTVIPGQSTSIQTEKTENGKTTVDETTYLSGAGPLGPMSHKRSVTDGETTTIDEQSKSADGTLQFTHDQYGTQTGAHGIRGEVSDGFSADGQTEVHDHSSLIIPKGDLGKITSDQQTTYSQGNHRVTRDQTGGKGGGATSWTQEVQDGDDYRAQTTVEGQPNLLIQVSRHADRDTGTVTEQTATSDPVSGKVSKSAQTTRGYDDEGRLTSSETVGKDKDGTTTTTDYRATYQQNADGTTAVAEDTTTDVKQHGQPDRKTEQHVESTDTKDGRRVDRVNTEVDVDGKAALIAESDGTKTTIEASLDGSKPDGKLVFDEKGAPADAVTAFLVQHSPIARDVALAGLNAVESGAQAAATGTNLLGAFADNAKQVGDLTKFLMSQVNLFGGLEDQIGFGYLNAVGFGGDGASGSKDVHTSDAVRLAQQGSARISDLLSIKTINDARALDFDAAAIAKVDAAKEATTLGQLGSAATIGGAIYSGLEGALDVQAAFKADNGLDRTDAIASAVGDFGSAGLAVAGLLEAGPPGWVVAAATLGLEAGVSEVHNIDDDLRRGHPDEALAEGLLLGLGGVLPAIALHLWFDHEDSDELRHHDLDSPVPQLA